MIIKTNDIQYIKVEKNKITLVIRQGDDNYGFEFKGTFGKIDKTVKKNGKKTKESIDKLIGDTIKYESKNK